MSQSAGLAAVVGLAALAMAATAMAASGPGSIGGRPTRALDPPPEGEQITPAMVIGAGQAYDGWVEVDAYGWKPESVPAKERRQFCTWVEFAHERLPTFGTCLATWEIEEPITIESAVSLIRPKALRWSEFGGALSPDVARVVISFKRPGDGQTYESEATVAQVSGRLQSKLGQPEPFGYFVAKVRGRIPVEGVRATAFDSAGTALDTTRGMG